MWLWGICRAVGGYAAPYKVVYVEGAEVFTVKQMDVTETGIAFSFNIHM